MPNPASASTFTNLYDGEIKPLLTSTAAGLSTTAAVTYLAGDRFITEVFTEGRMYYSIPVEHFLNPTYNKTNPSDPFLVGDFGVVRNHFYQVTVTDIKKVGIGVFDVTEPIVPNYDPSTYYLAAKLNILGRQLLRMWHCNYFRKEIAEVYYTRHFYINLSGGGAPPKDYLKQSWRYDN